MARLFTATSAVAIVLFAAVFATTASAFVAPKPSGIVPMFCGVNGSNTYKIPYDVPLTVRYGWATKNQAQTTQFRNSQKLVWQITNNSDGSIFDSRLTPTPEYGDTTEWSLPSPSVTGDGVAVSFTNYQHPTG